MQSIDLFLCALVAAIVLSFLLPFRKYVRRPVRFDPGQPYQVYSRDFDMEVKVSELDASLAALPDPDRAWSERFPDVGDDFLVRRASVNAAVQQAVAHIRSATSKDILDDTIVSLLIDHSGSMRGQPILYAAKAAMIASDLLQDIGAKQEVLGFTTVRWKGGRSREKWLRDGRPSYPGRLNDLLHIIYCGAGERLDARHCETMLRKDLLKENVDGEAIEWAASRLRRRAESQKYLIVVSDGAPVDDSTLLANGGRYLEQHLLSVIESIEQAGDIQLGAIGIGHPVGRYYKHSVSIDTAEGLDRAVLQLIEQLLCQSSRTPQLS